MILTQGRGAFLGLAVAALPTLLVTAWAGVPRRALVFGATLAIAGGAAIGLVQILPGGDTGSLTASVEHVTNVGEFAASVPAGDTGEATRPELTSASANA
jgi:hypothetical protein